jgi:ribosomal protein L10
MPTPKKERMVEELRERIARITIAVGADYRGLTVPEMVQLRRKMRSAGVELKVVKNTLTRLAAERAGRPVLNELIEGPTALAFGYGDIMAQLAGQLQSPLATLAALLEAPLTTFAGLMQATQQELVTLLETRARQMETA